MDDATGQSGTTAQKLAVWFPGRMVLDLYKVEHDFFVLCINN